MAKQLFVVSARPRASDGATLNFLVEADSHRDAWRVARQVCASGDGGFVRNAHNGELNPWSVPAGHYTVDRVLANAPHKRGRPPKITADDLLVLAGAQDVRVPPRITRLLDELQHAA